MATEPSDKREILDGCSRETREVVQSLDDLAMRCQKRGQYVEAELLLNCSLELRARTFGSEHLAVAQSLNRLAGLCLGRKEYSRAESLFKRSILIKENTLGSDHPDVAASLNGLASHPSTFRRADASTALKLTGW